MIRSVSNPAFNGHAESNQLNFQHFNLSEIALYLDSQQQHAIRPIRLDYENGLYIRAYHSLFVESGRPRKDEGLLISREDYNNGYALYASDLSAELSEDDQFSIVRLALKFAQSLLPMPNLKTSSRWIGLETSSLVLEYEFGRDRSLSESSSERL